MGIAPAFDVGKPDAADISGAFKKAGFTDREATALLGTLATLQSDDVVNAAPVEKEDRGASKTRGKMGRVAAGGKAKSTNCLLYTSPSPRDQRGSRMPSSA